MKLWRRWNASGYPIQHIGDAGDALGLLGAAVLALGGRAGALRAVAARPGRRILCGGRFRTGGHRGNDAGKKVNGRKRFIVTDPLGLLIVVCVMAASWQDRDGAKTTLLKNIELSLVCPSTPILALADSGGVPAYGVGVNAPMRPTAMYSPACMS